MKTALLAALSLAILLFTPGCATIIAKPYTKKTCVVTGEELGSSGEPVSIIYEYQEMQLCCSLCIETFNSDPKKYMARLPLAEDAPRESHHTH